MGFYAFYVAAIAILVAYFTGWLRRHSLEWVVLLLAAATFPAIVFLK
jgi:low affinity Fe/Cu permease